MLWGHARGLYVLTLTEMWERFSYYGMRALLIFYLIQKLSLTDAAAFSLYGNYTALVFVSPLLGDRSQIGISDPAGPYSSAAFS